MLCLFYFDLLEYIIEFIDQFEILYNLILVSKYLNRSIKNKFTNLKLKFIDFIYNKFPIFIVKLFKNISHLRNLVELKFNENFYGLTGDLDQIKEFQMSHPIMFSYDHHSNLFLILKLKIKINEEIITTCISIFQKSNFLFRWCINSNDSYYGIFFNRLIDESDIRKLIILLNGKVIKQNNSLLWIQ